MPTPPRQAGGRPRLQTGSIVIAATAFGLLAACAGELVPSGPGGGDPVGGGPDAGDGKGDDPGDTTDTTARGLFDANVHGVLVATCSPGGACHSAQDPAFVEADRAQAYDVIKAQRDRLYPGYEASGAKLIAKGDGNHYGATYRAADIEAISAWLAAEKAEAAGGGEVASPLAVWSGCMSLADWDAEGVANAWSNLNANNEGDCETCHNLGAEGFMASDQSLRVFESLTTSPAMMPSYFTLDASGSTVIINRTRFENVALKLAPHEEHGSFPVDGDHMDRLQRFYNLTAARLAAGQCEAPRFPQP